MACGARARADRHHNTVFPSPAAKPQRLRKAVLALAVPDAEEVPDVGWLWDSSVSRTKAQLQSINARPKKALGQNFVTDQNVLSRVVEKSGIQPGDVVLEIGPGTGNLTRSLLKVFVQLALYPPYKTLIHICMHDEGCG